MRIALATCRALPEPDPDQEPLLASLRSLGADARLLAWDDPGSEPGGFDLCVIRSTWNYVHHLPRFLAWARRTTRRTKLLNPYRVVRWNCDKRYLADMAARGVATVPTAYFPRGGRKRLKDIAAERGWKDLVLKPRVGAASFMTRRFSSRRLAFAEAFLRAAGRDMLIQPYVRSVETRGERSLVYVAGRLTHAVRKSPRLAGRDEAVTACPRIEADERAFALRALRPFRKDILYARVDVARDEAGGLMLMELELIEPSLYLVQEPRALALFAASCVAAAGRKKDRGGP